VDEPERLDTRADMDTYFCTQSLEEALERLNPLSRPGRGGSIDYVEGFNDGTTTTPVDTTLRLSPVCLTSTCGDG
jgi:hypothetical protein